MADGPWTFPGTRTKSLARLGVFYVLLGTSSGHSVLPVTIDPFLGTVYRARIRHCPGGACNPTTLLELQWPLVRTYLPTPNLALSRSRSPSTSAKQGRRQTNLFRSVSLRREDAPPVSAN